MKEQILFWKLVRISDSKENYLKIIWIQPAQFKRQNRRNSNENNVHFILAKRRSCGIMNKPRRSSKLNEHLMKETKYYE